MKTVFYGLVKKMITLALRGWVTGAAWYKADSQIAVAECHALKAKDLKIFSWFLPIPTHPPWHCSTPSCAIGIARTSFQIGQPVPHKKFGLTWSIKSGFLPGTALHVGLTWSINSGFQLGSALQNFFGQRSSIHSGLPTFLTHQTLIGPPSSIPSVFPSDANLSKKFGQPSNTSPGFKKSLPIKADRFTRLNQLPHQRPIPPSEEPPLFVRKHSTWCRTLRDDGDVELNPGPGVPISKASSSRRPAKLTYSSSKVPMRAYSSLCPGVKPAPCKVQSFIPQANHQSVNLSKNRWVRGPIKHLPTLSSILKQYLATPELSRHIARSIPGVNS